MLWEELASINMLDLWKGACKALMTRFNAEPSLDKLVYLELKKCFTHALDWHVVNKSHVASTTHQNMLEEFCKALTDCIENHISKVSFQLVFFPTLFFF